MVAVMGSANWMSSTMKSWNFGSGVTAAGGDGGGGGNDSGGGGGDDDSVDSIASDPGDFAGNFCSRARERRLELKLESTGPSRVSSSLSTLPSSSSSSTRPTKEGLRRVGGCSHTVPVLGNLVSDERSL